MVIRRPLVGVFLEPFKEQVYLPPTPLRWTPSSTLWPKTSGGSPKTTKPKHLPGRALPKPRTPRGVSPERHFGLLWELVSGLRGFGRLMNWCLGFEVLGLGFDVFGLGSLGFEVLGLGSAVLGLSFTVLALRQGSPAFRYRGPAVGSGRLRSPPKNVQNEFWVPPGPIWRPRPKNKDCRRLKN